ncbi:MAG: GNAT family N-acetyltransferase [Endozoicomonas sp. (ex Botrylloides leachii)]|nr:GNAT family N-acetyltransferase [Endozoicomonas sp. (ex Botrylloides leachii)]
MQIIVETSHLMVRTWQEQDLASYAVIVGDENATKLKVFGSETPQCRAETELWRYQLEQDKQGWSRWAVIHKGSQQLIGYCGFSRYLNEIEINWRFLPEYRCKLITIEIIEAVVHVGFNQFGFNKIISFTSPSNHRTLDVMKQVGMTLDRIEGWGQCSALCYSLCS